MLPGRSLLLCCVLAIAAGSVTACSQVIGGAVGSGPPTYYLSPAGNDAAAGTSPGTAWRTLRRASAAALPPGSRLLLQGGQEFTGQLRLTAGDGGNPRQPVRIGSYGRGRATIATAQGDGITVFDTGGIDISNLILRGGHNPPTGAGINLYSDLPPSRRPGHVTIDHVDVGHFADGVAVGSPRAGSGFYGVRLINSALHDNLDNGFLSYGPRFDPAAPGYANEDISISHVTAYGNTGDPAVTDHNTGSGIVLGSVRNATVSWSAAYQNGGAGSDRREGPQGIWAYDSTAVTIEHNVAYGNRTASKFDGGGFDLDQNTSDSTLQYNFSYRNSGPGYLLYTALHANPDMGDVVRFNISLGDVDSAEYYGGITALGRIVNTAIYQNTVVMAQRAGVSPGPAVRLGRGARAVTVRNNIFMTRQPGPVLAADVPLTRAAVLLQGNDYFSATGQWAATWGQRDYYSLADWRAATGQESWRGRATGWSVDPQLTGPLAAALVTRPGAGGNLFRLRSGSPLAGAGLDLAQLYRLRTDPADYSGQPVSIRAPNVGAE